MERSLPGPLGGGPWRVVAPDELLIRNPPAEELDDEQQGRRAAVTLERKQELEVLLRNGSADPEPYLELAQIYRSEDRLPQAIKTLERGLSIAPKDGKILWELEELRLNRSLARLQEAMRAAKSRGTPETLAERDRCQVEWANRRIEVCRARLERKPNDHTLRVTMATALRSLGQSKEAIEALQPAIDDPKAGPRAALVRGQCCEDLGEPLLALAAYRAAGLRRSIPIAADVRKQALAQAASLACRLGLHRSANRYVMLLSFIDPNDPHLSSLRRTIEQQLGTTATPPNREPSNATSDR
jgi:tetratricopeptide (TPR) repeat protein